MAHFFRFILVTFLALNFLSASLTTSALAETKNKLFEKNPELQISVKLRPRVNFWIDVFGNYNKAQVIIHHRRYPQIRFALLDIQQETTGMNDVLFDTYKDRALKAKLKEVREDIAFLAQGEAPKTTQQRTIEQAMRILGPGVAKYKSIIDDPELVRGQSGIRDKMEEAIQRSGRYLPILEDIFVNEFELPFELTRLPFVESSFDYKAYSSVAAAGIWQFMPRTSRIYMRLSPTVDERLDPIESTRAAAKYLRSAYARLGTWPLALTSYNNGVGGVLSKVRKFGTADISALIENDEDPPPFGFASTNFFPEFLAAKEVYNRRAEFFPGIKTEPSLQLTMIRLSRAVMVTEIKNKLGVSEDDLREANYALSERIWQGRAAIPAGYNLKVPDRYEARLVKAGFGESTENFSVDSTARIEPIVVALENTEKSNHINEKSTAPVLKNQESSKVTINSASTKSQNNSYTVKPGDTLYSIARDFGISVIDLKAENKIKSSSVFPGKVLILPQEKGSSESVKEKHESSKTALVKLYTVKKGDTPAAIAKKVGIPLSKLAAQNGLSAKKPVIKVGQVLRIQK